MPPGSVGPPFDQLLATAEAVAQARPEVDLAMAREVFHEAATLLHNGLALDGLDRHDSGAVVAGLCADLVAEDPGAAGQRWSIREICTTQRRCPRPIWSPHRSCSSDRRTWVAPCWSGPRRWPCRRASGGSGRRLARVGLARPWVRNGGSRAVQCWVHWNYTSRPPRADGRGPLTCRETGAEGCPRGTWARDVGAVPPATSPCQDRGDSPRCPRGDWIRAHTHRRTGSGAP